jgi:hypothetical protein
MFSRWIAATTRYSPDNRQFANVIRKCITSVAHAAERYRSERRHCERRRWLAQGEVAAKLGSATRSRSQTLAASGWRASSARTHAFPSFSHQRSTGAGVVFSRRCRLG